MLALYILVHVCVHVKIVKHSACLDFVGQPESRVSELQHFGVMYRVPQRWAPLDNFSLFFFNYIPHHFPAVVLGTGLPDIM